MTRSQRRKRSTARQNRAQRFALPAPAVATVRIGKEWIESNGVRILVPVTESIALVENPNEVKRGAARLATMEGFISELETAQRRAYSPLTVATAIPLKSGKPGKRSTSYTV